METYKRVFVIVLDSLGIGAMPDSEKFGDKGVDTFGHILDKMGTLDIPNLQKLGMLNLHKVVRWKAWKSDWPLYANWGDQQWKGYNDRPLGNDGNLYTEAVYYFYRNRFPKN